MNNLNPRLSPWFYIALAMAAGLIIGKTLESGHIFLFITAISLLLLAVILRLYDLSLLIPFLFIGYYRSVPWKELHETLSKNQKKKIAGEFILFNETLLKIPGSNFYLKAPPIQAPHGTRLYIEGSTDRIVNYVIPSRISYLGLENKFFLSLHNKIKVICDEIFGFYEESALIKALILGDRGELSGTTKENFRKCGVSHILAISGLHVNFIFLLFYTIFMFIFRDQRPANVLALIFVYFYVFTLGPLSPCFRAFAFLAITAMGYFVKRKAIPLNTWGASFTLSLFLYPSWIFDSSFLFSYTAVLGYILIPKDFFKSRNTLLNHLFNYLHSVTIPLIFTAPLQIVFFKSLSFLSLLSNLIFVPGIFIVIFESVFSIFFKFLGLKISLYFANCALYISHHLLKIASILAKFDMGVISF
ncbi:MAG: ComEC/Rec2 family competence protein [Candidatus Hydrothermia bacterium]